MTDRTARSGKWCHACAIIGLDLAMPLFQHHGLDAQGKVVMTRPLSRDTALVAQKLTTACASI
jgi:hypothetical protein